MSMCFTATLEMDFTLLDWRLSERSEQTVDCHAPSLLFLRDDFLLPAGCDAPIVSSVLSGLDWKVFKSSCLPKKFREDVTFGGTTYKVSGIPDGKWRK